MSNYDWQNKEQLIEHLKLSESTSSFLNNQNMVATSGNYDTFKKWMKFHSIDKQQYFKEKTKPVKKEKVISKIITKEDVLVLNSSYTRADADKIIRKENLIPYQCRCCGNEGSWCGKPLRLQLEHKNGDSTDHRIKNLEYLCPNCHTQTATYGSKNKHNRIFEARITYLKKIGEINYTHLEILAQRWKISSATVKNWLKIYSSKLIDLNISLNINIPRHKAKKNIESNNLRQKDLTLIKGSRKEFESSLAEKWGISTAGVKKWIKEYNISFYSKYYTDLSPTMKAKIYNEKIYMNIKEIIDECDMNKSYDLSKIISLFKNRRAALGYLKNKFSNYYKLFYVTPRCESCNSEKTSLSNYANKAATGRNRFKCYHCNKFFFENLIKYLDTTS